MPAACGRSAWQRSAMSRKSWTRAASATPGFLDLASAGEWDLLCHHAARVGDYRSPDFDVAGAVADNTRALVGSAARHARRLSGVVLTGSVFEQDEGAGNTPLQRFLALRPVEGAHRRRSCAIGARASACRSASSSSPTRSAPRGAALLRLPGRAAGRPARRPRCARRTTCATTSMSICSRAVMPPSPPQSPAGPHSHGTIRAAMSSSRAFSRSVSRARSRAAPAWNVPCCSAGRPSSANPRRASTPSPPLPSSSWDEAAAWDAVVDHYALARVSA